MFMAVSRFDARKQLVLDEANAGQEPGKKTLSLTS